MALLRVYDVFTLVLYATLLLLIVLAGMVMDIRERRQVNVVEHCWWLSTLLLVQGSYPLAFNAFFVSKLSIQTNVFFFERCKQNNEDYALHKSNFIRGCPRRLLLLSAGILAIFCTGLYQSLVLASILSKVDDTPVRSFSSLLTINTNVDQHARKANRRC